MRFIGPHVSIKDSIALAVGRAAALSATGFALFTKNQRVWSAPPLKAEEAAAFRKAMDSNGYASRAVLPHAGYLINPATPDEDLRRKSLSLLLDEAGRTAELGLDTLNIHPGAYREGSMEDGVKRAAAMIDEVLAAIPGIRIAIENTSGAGTILGSSFEELDMLLSEIRHSSRAGFTLDTAHLYGAGYDVKGDPDGVLDSFFSRFGKDRLFGMHLNDSKVPLASRKDRHESLGHGLIGYEPIAQIAGREETQGIPLILETPDESLWKDEIRMLMEA